VDTIKKMLQEVEQAINTDSRSGWCPYFPSEALLDLRQELLLALRLCDLVDGQDELLNDPLAEIVTTSSVERTADELNSPWLLVLPSGRPFRLDRVTDFGEISDLMPDAEHPRNCTHVASFIPDGAQDSCTACYTPTDAAAIRSAILRYGVEADAPTIRGEDADGDGLTGE
jgi:hypothetical protein